MCCELEAVTHPGGINKELSPSPDLCGTLRASLVLPLNFEAQVSPLSVVPAQRPDIAIGAYQVLDDRLLRTPSGGAGGGGRRVAREANVLKRQRRADDPVPSRELALARVDGGRLALSDRQRRKLLARTPPQSSVKTRRRKEADEKR